MEIDSCLTPGRGTLNDMEEAPIKVTLTEPGLACMHATARAL